MSGDLAKLRALGSMFTTSEATSALGATLSARMVAHQLRQLGFTSKRARHAGDKATRLYWHPPVDGPVECACRCHTGTCGENDMALAERTIRLVTLLRPTTADAVEALAYLVQRAGVDFARRDIEQSFDAGVPF